MHGNPKLPDDSGEVPKANEVDGGSIPAYEIFSLLDGNNYTEDCI